VIDLGKKKPDRFTNVDGLTTDSLISDHGAGRGRSLRLLSIIREEGPERLPTVLDLFVGMPGDGNSNHHLPRQQPSLLELNESVVVCN
jgi:hypothetical protein